MFAMYISFRRAIETWTIGYTHREHNHEMNPDPFQYVVHRNRRVGNSKAVEIAAGLRGEISYRKAQRILKNHDLEIGRKEFYCVLLPRKAPLRLNLWRTNWMEFFFTTVSGPG